MAVMDFSKEDIRARKAYFFAGRGIVCLGAGISSSHPEPVITTLNQCRLWSDVFVLRGGTSEAIGEAGARGPDIRAVWHDNVGYVMMEQGTIAVSTGTRSGSWSRVEEKASTDVVSEDVFICTIDHGSELSDASYAYQIVPGVSAEDLGGIVEKTEIRILANTSALQAVQVVPEGLVQAIFLVPGNIDHCTS